MNEARNTRNILVIILTLVSIASLLLPTAAVLAIDEGWPQFQKDCENSGITYSQPPISSINLGWRQKVDYGPGCTGVNVVPLVVDDKVFVIDSVASVWAYDCITGDTEWKTTLSSEGFIFQLATPAYGEGSLFVATNDGHVYALDAQNGGIIWENEIADVYDQLNTPVTYDDGKVYVGSWAQDSNGVFYCLDAGTGNVIWSRPSSSGGGYYWAGGCVIDSYFVYGDGRDYLAAVDKVTGATADEVYIQDLPYAPEIIEDRLIRSTVTWQEEGSGYGHLYFTDFAGSMGSDENGYLWKVGFDSGTGQFDRTSGSGWSVNIGYSTSTPVVYDGRIYVGNGNFAHPGELLCFDTDGNEIWGFEAIGGVESSPVISPQGSDVYIYFTANCPDGTAYCIDGNGNECWQFTTYEAGGCGGHILQGITAIDGWVYFGNDGEYMYALTDDLYWDVNEDGEIDYLDMILVGNHYGETGDPGWIREDVNDDGEVNYLDMIIIGNHYGGP